ncbi:MAG: methyltransferase domain-containing protein, partial [Muribaculaceae bacterium]|nr:methyltransferase domain-containing protein [Muribaculaceae bacterium]
SSPDIEKLKEELQFFNSLSLNSAEYTPKLPWKRVFIAENDRIIPSGNQINAWESLCVSPEIGKLPGGHYPDFLNLLKSIIPDTKAVGNHFSASLNSYDDSASAQKIIVDKLSTLLVNFIQTEKIRESELKVLEIGPGSGLFTKKWGKIITDAEATFIDLYPLPRYNVTKKERYVEQDAEEWLKYSSETFDIILSASTIQWFADPVGFIRQAFHHLNPGGLLLVSTFLPGNLGELDGIRPAPVIYHTHAEFERLCQGLSQEYLLDKEKIEVYFKSPRHALHHLRQTGVGHSPVKIKSRYEIEEALRLPDGSARLTFFPLYIAIKK